MTFIYFKIRFIIGFIGDFSVNSTEWKINREKRTLQAICKKKRKS